MKLRTMQRSPVPCYFLLAPDYLSTLFSRILSCSSSLNKPFRTLKDMPRGIMKRVYCTYYLTVWLVAGLIHRFV